MKRFIFPLILLVALGFAACEKVIDLDLPESEPQLVVDAWYTDEDTTQYVKLSTTAPYFEDQQAPRVSDAIVTLRTFENEDLIESVALSEDPENPGFYLIPEPAELGKGYQLEVDAPGFDPVRSDIQEILETPPIFDIYWEASDPSFEDSLAIYKVFISTFEFPGEGDAYRWFAWVDGEYQNKPENLYIANDLLVDGAVLPQFEPTDHQYRFGSEVRITQCRINQSAYDYLALLRQQTAFIGSPFDTPPAPLIGNMKFINKEGQALGFFGASSTSTAEVTVGL